MSVMEDTYYRLRSNCSLFTMVVISLFSDCRRVFSNQLAMFATCCADFSCFDRPLLSLVAAFQLRYPPSVKHDSSFDPHSLNVRHGKQNAASTLTEYSSHGRPLYQAAENERLRRFFPTPKLRFGNVALG